MKCRAGLPPPFTGSTPRVNGTFLGHSPVCFIGMPTLCRGVSLMHLVCRWHVRGTCACIEQMGERECGRSDCDSTGLVCVEGTIHRWAVPPLLAEFERAARVTAQLAEEEALLHETQARGQGLPWRRRTPENGIGWATQKRAAFVSDVKPLPPLLSAIFFCISGSILLDWRLPMPDAGFHLANSDTCSTR